MVAYAKSKGMVWLQLCLVILLQTLKTNGYKPVILIHGILDDAKDLSELKSYIQKAHPGTEVHTLDVFDHYKSFEPLWSQLTSIKDIVSPIMEAAKDGVHVIGYSQGGLLARGLIQTTDAHNIDTFIGLSSPLNGQFGDTSFINWLLPSALKRDLYKIFYTADGQLFSIGNYWKDPHHSHAYMKYSSYLAALNNESRHSDFEYPQSWRHNFKRLEKVILIGGPDDGVIAPWQSAHFSCFNKKEKVVPLKSLRIYQDDTFGLQSLANRGALKLCTIPGVKHTSWHRNETVFHDCIEPWLT